MTAITYTVKRELEETGVSISASDISASDTDDSFNSNSSPATDLSVFTGGRGIKVAGFDTVGNNGYFELAGSPEPIITKIVVTTPLTTEAQGNSIIITEYYRVYGSTRSFNLSLRTLDRSSNIIKTTQRALGGNSETIRIRNDVYWDMQTALIHIDNIPAIREFIHSVDAGESFTFDPYGSVAVSDSPRSVEMDQDSYQETREEMTNYFRISLRFREI